MSRKASPPATPTIGRNILLEELGLTGKENPSDISGGEARRAAIARVLAPEPDILLLDEPTNHLDLPAIEWLESELKLIRSAKVIISHDRRFLENLTRNVVWIDRGTARRSNRGFANFEAWRDEVFEQEQIEEQKLKQKILGRRGLDSLWRHSPAQTQRASPWRTRCPAREEAAYGPEPPAGAM